MSPAVGRSVLSVVLLLGCRATTGRPAFDAFPEAEHVQLGFGYEDRVRTVMELTDTLAAAFRADSIPLARVKTFDGFFETDWLDTATRRPYGGRPLGQQAVKVRVWVNPTRPGFAEVEAETVYQPVADPSRRDRDLEQPVPPGHPINRRVAAVLEKLAERYGLPEPAEPGGTPGTPPRAPVPAPVSADTGRLAPDSAAVPDTAVARDTTRVAPPPPPAVRQPDTVVVAPRPDTTTPPATGRYRVQVIATATHSAAVEMAEQLRAAGYPVSMLEEDGFHKVRAGPYATRSEANTALAALRRLLGVEPFLVVDP